MLEFNIDADVEDSDQDIFLINIIEKDIRNNIINNHKISFGKYKGIKQVEFTTNKDTTEIKLEFCAKEKSTNRELTINSLKLNGKEYPLQYKYIPTKLVQKIKNISINYKTAQERIEMIKTATELSKDSWLTGIGGDGWQYKYKEKQSYDYISNYVHSYPAKVILEFGIIGIVSYVGIVLLIVKNIQNREINNISITFALLMIIAHCTIDIDMEYTHVLIYVFTLMANLSKNLQHNDKNNFKLSYVANIVLIGTMAMIAYASWNIKKFDRNNNISDLLTQRKGLINTSVEYQEINCKIAKEYEKMLKTERYDYILAYGNIIKYYINSNYEKREEVISEYYNKIKDYKNTSENNPKEIVNKFGVINIVICELEEQNKPAYNELAQRFAEIIIDEYQETKAELEKCLKKQHIQNSLEQQGIESLYLEAQEIKKKYLCGVKIFNNSEISINEEELKNIKTNIGENIVIYHTHGTESYRSSEPYNTYKFYRTVDKNYNVIKIGEQLSELLKNKGYKVIHNKEYFDIPSTAGAYSRAIKRVNEIISENNEVSLVIDIHRDAISETEHVAKTVEIEGKKVAPLRFVVGTEMNEKEWQNNLKIALDIQRKAEERYPGLFQPILIRQEEYQMGLKRNAILLEVGENCNELEEATNAIEYFVEILDKCLN